MKYVVNLPNLKNCHPEVERIIRGYGTNIGARSLKNLVVLMKSVKSVVKKMLLKEIQSKQKFPHVDRRLLSPLSQEEWDHLSSFGEFPWCDVHTCMFTCLRSYREIRTTLKVLLTACFEMGSFVDCCVLQARCAIPHASRDSSASASHSPQRNN